MSSRDERRRSHHGHSLAFIFYFCLSLTGFGFNHVATAPTAENTIEKRLVGGTTAAGPDSWPWQVSLQWRLDLGDFQRLIHLCGGALISPKWILTAGHCFRKYNKPEQWVARLAEYNLFEDDGTEISVNVKRLVTHPLFDSAAGYDIALAELAEPINVTPAKEFLGESSETFLDPESFIRPVHLPVNKSMDFQGKRNCFVTGWGETRSTASRRTLRQVGGDIWQTQDCKDKWTDRLNLQRQICFGNGVYGPCLGDSGGPLVCFGDGDAPERDASRGHVTNGEATHVTDGEATIVGVVSFGTQTCDKKGWPGVFTSVAYHVDWIKQYL